MTTPGDLKKGAALFGQQLNDLLNGTVADGVRLTTVTSESGDRAWIGYRIGRKNLSPRTALPLTISAARPKAYLHVLHALTLEPETGYLTTARSDASVYLDAEMKECFCRYEYERDKPDGYPEAHLHVHAETPALGRCTVSSKVPDMAELHFPVGGRRFRPALEDVIGFLVREGLAKGKPGWHEIVDTHRRRFYKIQLKAAVRRDPDAARAMLADLDSAAQ